MNHSRSSCYMMVIGLSVALTIALPLPPCFSQASITNDYTMLWLSPFQTDDTPSCVSVSSDGSYILIGSSNRLYIVDRNKTPVWTRPTDFPIVDVSMTADAGRIAAAGSSGYFWGGKLYVFDRGQTSWEERVATPVTYGISSLSLSPEGNYLAMTYVHGLGWWDVVALWGYNEGKWLWDETFGIEESTSVGISADAGYVAVGGAGFPLLDNDEFRVYDIRGRLVWSYLMDSTWAGKYSVAISANGKFIVGGNDRDNRVYFLNCETRSVETYNTGHVQAVSISGDGRYAVVASNAKIYLFDVVSQFLPQRKEPLWTKELNNIQDVAISADGSTIAAVTYDNKVYVFVEQLFCKIELRREGRNVETIGIGEWFDISITGYAGGIKTVRFLSDESQNGKVDDGFTWTDPYDWGVSKDDWTGRWDASTKTKTWAFATPGQKEVWAEVSDSGGQVRRCRALISAILKAPEITGVTPAYPQARATRQDVTISGSNFVQGATVIFEDPIGREWRIPRKDNDWIDISPQEIKVRADLFPPGTWKVRVENPDGRSSNKRELHSIGAAIDEHLLDLIDKVHEYNADEHLAALQEKRDYYGWYHPCWSETLSLDQYKAWIATIAWGEGGKGGYVAHSQGEPGRDVFSHRGAPTFRFSTGIGPFQIDNIEVGAPEGPFKILKDDTSCSVVPSQDDDRVSTEPIDATSMPTIDKLDYEKALMIVLIHHFDRYNRSEVRLSDFAEGSPWYAVNTKVKHPGAGGAPSDYPGYYSEKLEERWAFVTGTKWSDHERQAASLNWGEIRNRLAANAAGQEFRYENNVWLIGWARWKVKTRTDAGRDVILDGYYQTWLITARDSNGRELFKYYYTDTPYGIEVWVWADDMRYVFVRDYSKTVDGQKPEGVNGATAGETLRSSAIESFIVRGDLDGSGSVTVVDATIAIRISLGLVQPSYVQLMAGDLDGDGGISVAEGTWILRAALGLREVWPGLRA